MIPGLNVSILLIALSTAGAMKIQIPTYCENWEVAAKSVCFKLFWISRADPILGRKQTV